MLHNVILIQSKMVLFYKNICYMGVGPYSPLLLLPVN